jgi:phosphoribosylamine--glycine ligase
LPFVQPMNILLIGSGGREHALAWKIKQSKLTDKLFIAPGNAGTSLVGENIHVLANDFKGLAGVCVEKKIDLVVVGPELPLVNGLRDYFENDPALKSILMVGPGKKGAQLEGSKDFSKLFMQRHGIPTAAARTFSAAQLEEGLRYLNTCALPIVLKADGLAAGKGVIICQTLEEARNTLTSMLGDRLFGDASSQVLVEEFLDGIELSVFVLTDGTDYVLLPEAKDYKRIGDDDQGPNTGGMGAVSPVPFATPVFMHKVIERIIRPTIAGLKKENIPYRGFIFFGLISVKGEPFVIEYNARMGDPETEAVIPRIQSDLVELLVACGKGELASKTITFSGESAVCVVMVSGGYPEHYEKGKVISGLDKPSRAFTFHAGTKHDNSHIVTDGGRVLAVTGTGSTMEEAKKIAYASISGISWSDVYFRKDIGVDLLRL